MSSSRARPQRCHCMIPTQPFCLLSLLQLRPSLAHSAYPLPRCGPCCCAGLRLWRQRRMPRPHSVTPPALPTCPTASARRCHPACRYMRCCAWLHGVRDSRKRSGFGVSATSSVPPSQMPIVHQAILPLHRSTSTLWTAAAPPRRWATRSRVSTAGWLCGCLCWLLPLLVAPAADRSVHLQLAVLLPAVATAANRRMRSQARQQPSPAFPTAHLPGPCQRVLLPLQWTMLP